jgi:hypothetical protein
VRTGGSPDRIVAGQGGDSVQADVLSVSSAPVQPKRAKGEQGEQDVPRQQSALRIGMWDS